MIYQIVSGAGGRPCQTGGGGGVRRGMWPKAPLKMAL